MKKTVLVLLSLLLLAVACAAVAQEPLTVGILQLVENGAFKDMREGFIARVRELGIDEDQLVFTQKNAAGDMSNLYALCQNLADDEVDAVVAIATPAAQAMVAAESGIPVFFISVSNPVGAGIITEMAAPDQNATGTSNAIPVDEMFKLSDRLTPGVGQYGLLYCASQVNSVTTIESAKAYLEQSGIAYEEAVVTSSSEVYEATLALIEGGAEAIFCPNDSVIQDAMEVVAEAAREAKIPVYGSSAVMVRSGAFATVSISDPQIGAITADMFVQHLRGTPIEEIPAVVVDQFSTVLNKTTADAIGVSLSEDVLASCEIVE